MPLLGQQQLIEDQIIDYFDQHHNTSLWLSGEPGVGKTYITSAYIENYLLNHPHHHVLVISPSTMTKKWQKVLSEYNPERLIQELKFKKNELETIEEPIVPKADITILNNHHLTWLDQLNPDYFQLIVYDEFHEAQPGRKAFEHLESFFKRTAYRPNLLALTGTVFNLDPAKLIELIAFTNPVELTKYSRSLRSYESNFALNRFINRLWQYISVTINLDNVEAQLSKQDVTQTIMPINLIPLSKEEQAFYEFVNARLNSIKAGKKQLASDLLDFPQDDQFINKYSNRRKTFADIDTADIGTFDASLEDYNLAEVSNLYAGTKRRVPRKFHRKKEYIAALTLNKIEITNTQKYQALQKILQNNPDQTVLILLNSSKHLTRLQKAVKTMTDRNVETLNPHSQPTKRAQIINDYLNQKSDNIMIANANSIKTGIDLNSVNIIVWYQLLPNLSDILQTQRRAHRLNSQEDSKVYYLAYKDTAEEKLIKNLSESNTRNAAAYSARSTDALSQLQGILFKEFN